MQKLSAPGINTRTDNRLIIAAGVVIKEILLELVGKMAGPGIRNVKVREYRSINVLFACSIISNGLCLFFNAYFKINFR